MRSTNVRWHEGEITRTDRETLLDQKGVCLWFTGLSGSGKSTLAREVEQRLHALGHLVYVLDGDNVRHGLNGDLSFSDRDRHENIRRIGEVAKLFADAGVITLTAFISPFKEDRRAVRSIMEQDRFLEVYVECPLDVCEQRDVKGLYAKARKNEITEFTGISSPYEAPEAPEIRVNTADLSLEDAAGIIIKHLRDNHIIETT